MDGTIDDENIVELTIEDVFQCEYKSSKLITFGNTQICLVAVCGYVTKIMDINGDNCTDCRTTMIEIDDTTGTICCFMDYEEQPKALENYVSEQLEELTKRQEFDDNYGSFGRRRDLFLPYQDLFDEEFCSFMATVDSIPYSNTLNVGELIMLAGRVSMYEKDDGLKEKCIFRNGNKMIRITSDTDEYLKNWLQKCREWKNSKTNDYAPVASVYVKYERDEERNDERDEERNDERDDERDEERNDERDEERNDERDEAPVYVKYERDEEPDDEWDTYEPDEERNDEQYEEPDVEQYEKRDVEQYEAPVYVKDERDEEQDAEEYEKQIDEQVDEQLGN